MNSSVVSSQNKKNSTTDLMMLIENCAFVALEKGCDRVPRKELWYCMRKSGVAEKYV